MFFLRKTFESKTKTFYNMQLEFNVTINRPIEEAIEILLDIKQMKSYMDGLLNVEVISGRRGELGCKTRYEFKKYGRRVDVYEELVKVDLPSTYNVFYIVNGQNQYQESSFVRKANNKTEYKLIIKQTHGLLFLGFILKRSIKKAANKFMRDFKNYVESK